MDPQVIQHLTDTMAIMVHNQQQTFVVAIAIGALALILLTAGIWAIIYQMVHGFREMHAENMNVTAVAQSIAAQTRELLRGRDN